MIQKKQSTCPKCNSTFMHYPSIKRVFCSRACRMDSIRTKPAPTICQCCGKDISHKRLGAKFCDLKCSGKYKAAKQIQRWLPCSKCMAALGLGTTKTGQLLSVNTSAIHAQWRKHGIKAEIPKAGSWSVYAKRKQKGQNPHKAKSKNRIIYEQYWMQDIKKAHSDGFTWAYIWTKEKAKRNANERYHNMTDAEKKEWNKRCTERSAKRYKQDEEYRERCKAYGRKWKRKNKDKVQKYAKYFRKRNPGYVWQQRKVRMTKDPAYRALQNQRKSFKQRMKLVKKGGSESFSTTLGCTTKEFRRHIESQFDKRMSWDNYGTYWHIDHILPCASFDHTDPEQVKMCWHWSNLQPMEATENIQKSDKIYETQMSLLFEYIKAA